MKILQRLKDGANRATEKAQGAVEISKLNNQIADVEKEMEFHFIEMGRVFYEGYSQEDMTLAEKEMLKHCKTCDGLQEEIEQLRRRIAELKNEKLCKCGRTVELDANFCPSCGRSLKGEAPASARDEGRKSPAAAKFEDEDFGETKIYREPIVQDDDDFEFELAFDKEETGAAAESLYDYPGGNDWKEPQEEEFADERERRQAEERERERQLELDERIRFWKENNDGKTEAAGASQRDSVKCQICRADLPKGSKWCPRCGAEQI